MNLLGRLARIAPRRSLRRRLGALSLAVAAALPAPGCIGPYAATRRLWHWNSHWEEEWAREGLFLVTSPAYLLFAAGDTLLFNAVCFWNGGDGWFDEPGGDRAFQATLPIDGREELVVERAGDGWLATLRDGQVELASWPLAELPLAASPLAAFPLDGARAGG